MARQQSQRGTFQLGNRRQQSIQPRNFIAAKALDKTVHRIKTIASQAFILRQLSSFTESFSQRRQSRKLCAQAFFCRLLPILLPISVKTTARSVRSVAKSKPQNAEESRRKTQGKNRQNNCCAATKSFDRTFTPLAFLFFQTQLMRCFGMFKQCIKQSLVL